MYRTYNSVYKDYIIQFIELKKRLGFKFITAQNYLADIDKFACKTNQISLGITREFCESYSEIRINESPNNRFSRISMLARLSSYIADIGIESYIPRLPLFPKNTFTPYIFNQEEIYKLFQAADNLKLTNHHSNTNLFSFPLMLRFLYSTGIRISEAKNLKNKDVNLENGFINIKDSKNGKERIIPIDESLITLSKEYLLYKNFIPFDRGNSNNFFINLSGNKCGPAINIWFKKCLEIVGIKCVGKNQNPRIHDLRHTFAVTSLARMADSGIDLYASLPILSTYLGHQSISATNHYVRLTSSLFPELIKDLDNFYLDVFPKFIEYEDN